MSPVAITRPLRTGPGHLSEHRDREGKMGPVAIIRPSAQALGIRPNAASTKANSFAKCGEAVRPDRLPSFPAAALAWATVPGLRTDAASVARSAHGARIRGALRYTTLKTRMSTAARCGRRLSSVPTYTPRFSQACGPSGAVISSVEKA
jgi:hypothetical protein